MEWFERVPKSNREEALAGMTEGQYLGVLRTAALRNERPQANLSSLCEVTGVARKILTEMEDGHRPATFAIAKAYCDAMGVPITILQKVGKRALQWPTQEPEKPLPPTGITAEIAEAKRKAAERDEQAKERRRSEKSYGDEVLVLDGASSVVIRNHLTQNLVFTFKNSGGVVVIDVFDNDPKNMAKELSARGFDGVRVVALQALEYDLDKEHVNDVRVPTGKKA